MISLFFLVLAAGCILSVLIDVKRTGGDISGESFDEWRFSLDLRRLAIARSLIVSALLFAIAAIVMASPKP